VPVTRDEMINYSMMQTMKNQDISKLFRIKRKGADLDPIFWAFGKIHGLENIAFADQDEFMKAASNPILL